MVRGAQNDTATFLPVRVAAHGSPSLEAARKACDPSGIGAGMSAASVAGTELGGGRCISCQAQLLWLCPSLRCVRGCVRVANGRGLPLQPAHASLQAGCGSADCFVTSSC